MKRFCRRRRWMQARRTQTYNRPLNKRLELGNFNTVSLGKQVRKINIIFRYALYH